ncbi:hypothetical protein LOK49_LG13G01999, partial [Camellia lanceoleosa]
MRRNRLITSTKPLSKIIARVLDLTAMLSRVLRRLEFNATRWLATADDSTKGKGVHVQEGNDYDGLDDIWKEMTVALECSKMKNGKEFLLTDTVGFIQKLPTTLIDKASDPLKIKLEAEKRQDTVCISAINGDGLDEFCSAVQEKLKEIDAGFIPMIGKTVFAMHIYCFWYMLYYSSVFGSVVIYILCGPLLLGCYYSQNNYGLCSSRVQLLIALNNCGIALTCAYLVMGSHGKKVRYEGK